MNTTKAAAAVATPALFQSAGRGGHLQAGVVEGVRFSERIQSGDVEGADFAAGLFAAWIGPRPPDAGLKKILPGDP
jgi:hypothetical protein